MRCVAYRWSLGWPLRKVWFWVRSSVMGESTGIGEIESAMISMEIGFSFRVTLWASTFLLFQRSLLIFCLISFPWKKKKSHHNWGNQPRYNQLQNWKKSILFPITGFAKNIESFCLHLSCSCFSFLFFFCYFFLFFLRKKEVSRAQRRKTTRGRGVAGREKGVYRITFQEKKRYCGWAQ